LRKEQEPRIEGIRKKYHISFLTTFILILFWSIFVLYPRPWLLGISIYRLYTPPVNSAAVAPIAKDLVNSSPEEIEQVVYQLLPYAFDWQVYNMPWYFPTLEESLENSKGDCKARFLLFASLLEALEIPHNRHISPMHIWVEYEGKTETAAENKDAALITTDDKGKTKVQIPKINAEHFIKTFLKGFWEVMPPMRKALFLRGPPLILLAVFLWNRRNIFC
jgi:hypothetical protein